MQNRYKQPWLEFGICLHIVFYVLKTTALSAATGESVKTDSNYL